MADDPGQGAVEGGTAPDQDLSSGQTVNGEAAKWRRQLRDLEASLPGQLDQARAEARAEMTKAVLDSKIEARAAALGFVDPADAIGFVGDRSKLLDDKGTPDREAIDAALGVVLEAKSYLAGAKRNGHGSADQGARGGSRPSSSSGDWARDLLAKKT